MKWNFLYQITAASRTPFSLSSVLKWICWTPPPNKIPGYATVRRSRVFVPNTVLKDLGDQVALLDARLLEIRTRNSDTTSL